MTNKWLPIESKEDIDFKKISNVHIHVKKVILKTQINGLHHPSLTLLFITQFCSPFALDEGGGREG